MIPIFSKTQIIIKEYIYKKLRAHYRRSCIPSSLAKHLNQYKSIILVDVGAYNGDFTRGINEYCKILRGVLIEPLPHQANNLRIQFNSDKYKIFEYALSSEKGMIDLEINEFEPTSSILKIKRGIPELANINLGQGRTIQCRSSTLDEIMLEAGIDKIDLLKIDVQGAEHLVLAGAQKTLSNTSMIWIEVSFKPLYEMSSTFFDIYSFLYSFNFKLYELEPGFCAPDGELLQSDALFIRKNS